MYYAELSIISWPKSSRPYHVSRALLKWRQNEESPESLFTGTPNSQMHEANHQKILKFNLNDTKIQFDKLVMYWYETKMEKSVLKWGLTRYCQETLTVLKPKDARKNTQTKLKLNCTFA